MNRLLVPHAAPGPLTVDGQRFHYLTRVLRVRDGDPLEVFDGRGHAFAATVDAVGETAATLRLGPARQVPAPRELTVVQGLPKGDKLELVLQKGTELGASAFAPALTARTVVRLQGKESARLARWQRIVEEAARQCGRSDVPHLHPPAPLADAVAALPGAPLVLVLDEEETALPLSHAVAAERDTRRALAVVVGPEGGLTRDEVQGLVARGAVAVTLGRRILRTETAALAALAVLRHLDGELG